MILLGLTGSIGMGKSTVAAMLREAGVPVFDADAEVRAMQAAGGAALPAIEEAFPGTTGLDGLDRLKLGQAVFGNTEALAKLEAIMHPRVRAVQEAFMAGNAAEPIVALDIPLLFEKGGSKGVHATMVVSAPAEVQRARVLARPGMTVEKFEAILAQQLPDADKRARADFVIDTGVSIADTRAAVHRIVDCLRLHGVDKCRDA
ncbi:dephospho-CoA kinase [Sphingoaurantiacus capsulatus]|uniref:Dephospho-CoA kinase n=1 Tax=Sphingoaurantiacus capsulatus TaxID=1771310 RepID=A0ABV7XI77_9SPHN